MIAEAISMLVYYPFEVIKVRYITKNDHYQYKGVADALKNLMFKEGVKGMYMGSNYFLANYMLSYTMQIVIYETYMDLKKAKLGI